MFFELTFVRYYMSVLAIYANPSLRERLREATTPEAKVSVLKAAGFKGDLSQTARDIDELFNACYSNVDFRAGSCGISVCGAIQPKYYS